MPLTDTLHHLGSLSLPLPAMPGQTMRCLLHATLSIILVITQVAAMFCSISQMIRTFFSKKQVSRKCPEEVQRGPTYDVTLVSYTPISRALGHLTTALAPPKHILMRRVVRVDSFH